MQHVVLYFRHDIRDIIPFHDAVGQLRRLVSDTEIGEYLGDDMAIDGGDAEAVFSGADADLLYQTISPVLKELPFLQGAKVTLVYGPLNSGATERTFEFRI